jgi:phage-related protein (TIGR01555 family)
MGAFTFVTDTLRNLASGLMSERDKVAANEFYFNEVDPSELEAMYRGDWMAGKAVDIPAFDSVREWRNWQASAEQIELLEAGEKRLGLKEKILEAMIYGRLYGGAALFLGVGTDDPSTPLNPERVKQGDLKYVHVLTRYDLSTNELRKNPEDEWFGEPVDYTLATETGVSLIIHPSRIITFTGNRKPQRITAVDPWGDSVLARVRDAMGNAALSGQAVAQMLMESKLDVLKIPQLMSVHLATADSTERLRTRLATAMSLKSSVNALVLDKEEEYEQKQVGFEKLPEIMQQYLLIVSGAVDIPATRFLGQSPGGLNATGDSDLKNYYDRIGAEQRLTLTPRLSRLDEVFIRSELGSRDEAIHYTWGPLYQTSEKEHAEIEKSRSETFKNYANMGLLNDGVLAKVLETALIESGLRPGCG